MDRFNDLLTQRLESVFGPADGRARFSGAARFDVESQRCDLATLHRLEAGSFTFRSEPPVAHIQGLSTIVVFVRGGSLKIEQIRNSKTIGAGDIFLISNWTPFVISATGPLIASAITVPLWWAFQKIVPDRPVNESLMLPSAMFCSESLHAMNESLFKGALTGLQAAKAVQMVAEMLRSAFDIYLGDAKPAPTVAARVGEIMRYICRNIQSEGVTPQTAAEALNCSVRTIHKACADQGTSFNKLLMDARIHAVAYQLTTSTGSISDIAYSVGFSSFSHFCRLFKTQTGLSASEYRRQYSTN